LVDISFFNFGFAGDVSVKNLEYAFREVP